MKCFWAQQDNEDIFPAIKHPITRFVAADDLAFLYFQSFCQNPAFQQSDCISPFYLGEMIFMERSKMSYCMCPSIGGLNFGCKFLINLSRFVIVAAFINRFDRVADEGTQARWTI